MPSMASNSSVGWRYGLLARKCFEAIIAVMHGDERSSLALGRGFVENNFPERPEAGHGLRARIGTRPQTASGRAGSSCRLLGLVQPSVFWAICAAAMTERVHARRRDVPVLTTCTNRKVYAVTSWLKKRLLASIRRTSRRAEACKTPPVQHRHSKIPHYCFKPRPRPAAAANRQVQLRRQQFEVRCVALRRAPGLLPKGGAPAGNVVATPHEVAAVLVAGERGPERGDVDRVAGTPARAAVRHCTQTARRGRSARLFDGAFAKTAATGGAGVGRHGAALLDQVADQRRDLVGDAPTPLGLPTPLIDL